jgi:hypothetical protein
VGWWWISRAKRAVINLRSSIRTRIRTHANCVAKSVLQKDLLLYNSKTIGQGGI